MKVVIFEVSNQKFAINIENIQRIIEYIKPSPLPGMNKYFQGLINFEESTIPIYSMNELLFNNKNTNNNFILIGLIGNKKIGLIVESILTILDVELQLNTKSLEFLKNESITSIIEYENQLVALLDINILLNK